jgi:putative transcriptional regulator
MKMQRVKIDPASPATFPPGRVDKHRLDTTTEQDIKRQQQADDVQSMQDAARFARRVRRRLGLTQVEFSRRIDVSIDTIRNWEQGRLYPTGPAKALLKLLNKIPETALSALD